MGGNIKTAAHAPFFVENSSDKTVFWTSIIILILYLLCSAGRFSSLTASSGAAVWQTLVFFTPAGLGDRGTWPSAFLPGTFPSDDLPPARPADLSNNSGDAGSTIPPASSTKPSTPKIQPSSSAAGKDDRWYYKLDDGRIYNLAERNSGKAKEIVPQAPLNCFRIIPETWSWQKSPAPRPAPALSYHLTDQEINDAAAYIERSGSRAAAFRKTVDDGAAAAMARIREMVEMVETGLKASEKQSPEPKFPQTSLEHFSKALRSANVPLLQGVVHRPAPFVQYGTAMPVFPPAIVQPRTVFASPAPPAPIQFPPLVFPRLATTAPSALDSLQRPSFNGGNGGTAGPAPPPAPRLSLGDAPSQPSKPLSSTPASNPAPPPVAPAPSDSAGNAAPARKPVPPPLSFGPGDASVRRNSPISFIMSGGAGPSPSDVLPTPSPNTFVRPPSTANNTTAPASTSAGKQKTSTNPLLVFPLKTAHTMIKRWAQFYTSGLQKHAAVKRTAGEAQGWKTLLARAEGQDFFRKVKRQMECVREWAVDPTSGNVDREKVKLEQLGELGLKGGIFDELLAELVAGEEVTGGDQRVSAALKATHETMVFLY